MVIQGHCDPAGAPRRERTVSQTQGPSDMVSRGRPEGRRGRLIRHLLTSPHPLPPSSRGIVSPRGWKSP